MRIILSIAILIFIPAGSIFAQTDRGTEARGAATSPEIIELQVPAGTPLPVVLEKDLRVRKAGQIIQGKIAEPVFAFDKLVIPAGSDVAGSIVRIHGVSAYRRTRAALGSDFTPAREIEVTFDQLVLSGGKQIALRTQVAPAQGVLQLATAPDEKKSKKKNGAVNLASEIISEKKQEINQEWEIAKKQIKAPGKLHWLKRLAIAELPARPQYIDGGTRFNAEILDPLNFGTEELSPDKLRMFGGPPSAGSTVHATLKTALSSASAQRGTEVEAVMTEPLLTDNQLVLPEGTLLKGAVTQVRPARRFHRNGKLRIFFREIAPPNSAEQKVEASLEGVETKNEENLMLDSEGGAQATTSKTRYLTTGFSIALAGVSFLPDADPGSSGQSVLEILNRGANGFVGFHVVGFGIGLLVRSRPLASVFGVYGASRAVYNNFLSRGQEVEYPKDSAMAIGFGSRGTDSKKNPPRP
ncbi:MAG TPA: hypothetical protein VGI34_01875 [Candidatus Acidoferrales bacterium]